MNKIERSYNSIKYFALGILVLLSLFSCRKDSVVGSNVLPAGSILGAYVIDTTTIISSIKLKDSVLSNSTSLMMLGSYYDPVFGPTKASVYTQLTLPGNTIDWQFNTLGNGFPLYFDSVVLVLPFNSAPSYYGALSPQTFTVDTIERVNNVGLIIPHSYYSDTNISHSNNHIGVATITPNPADSFHSKYSINNVATYPPALRIKLNRSFGQWIIKEDSLYGNLLNGYFSTGLTFQTMLEGFYVSVSDPLQLPGQGGIMYVNPYTAGAGLTFYYRIGTDTIPPQTFQIGSNCEYFGHFDHDYSKTAFYAGTKDSVVAPYTTYIQALGGPKTQLSFPFLSNWKKLGPIVVNKAEVDVPVNLSATGVDIPPTQAYLVRDSAGVEFALIDQNEGATYYGGTYDATNHQYVFNIDRYIQQVLDSKIIDTGLYLIAGSNAVSANGVVLYGAAKNTSNPRIRLKIYYTPLRR